MKRCSYILVLTLCLAGTLLSQSKHNQRSTQHTNVSWAQRALQGYNMRVWISNQMTMGLQAWDAVSGDGIPVDPHFGMEYPANSGVEHIYGLGPRIGGIKNGVKYVVRGYEGAFGGKEFLPNRNHYLRERIWQTSTWDSIGTPNVRNRDDDNDGLIDEDDLDGTDNDGDWNPENDDVGADGLSDPYEISCDGIAYDATTNPDPGQDNYDPDSYDKCHPNPDGSRPLKNNRDQWTENNGIPDHGEPNVDEDYGAVSQNDLYCSATDTTTGPIIGGPLPLGVKLIQKSYAWNTQLFDAILPFDYYFINVGRQTITDVYIGFFADMDVGPVNVPGYQLNNYAAYIHELKTVYIHNPIDRGSTPAGLTILGTPKPLDSLQFIFNWSGWPYSDSTATGDSLAYDMMSGGGIICIPEDPLCGPIEQDQPIKNPTDTRFLLSFGPFEEFKQFDTIKISMALISGYGINEGVNSLVENAATAVRFYNRSYNMPPVPLSPKLEVQKGNRRAEIKWFPHACALDNSITPFDVWDDSNKLAGAYPDTHWRRVNPPCGIDCIQPGGRIICGFRLYRSESQSIEPEQNSFSLLYEYILPEDANLEMLNKIDSVYIDSTLSWGRRYWYAVTSIGLPDISIIANPQWDGTIRYDTLYSDYTESSLRENWEKVDMEFLPSESAGQVLAVPNPYRVDIPYSYENGGWEGYEKSWSEFNRLMKFIHMPMGEWTMRIFTIAGEIVKTISNTRRDGYRIGDMIQDVYREDRGEINYNLLNEAGWAIASGVYIFTVESDFGTQTGKFVVIR